MQKTVQTKNKKWWGDETRLTRSRVTNVAEQTRILSLDQMPKLYTVKEVAAYFQVNIFTVYVWKAEGLIVPTMQGRSVRFTAEAINDCKNRREHRNG
jgi:excisionase family DNA binding protein